MIRRWLRRLAGFVLWLIVFALLTALTQIGGVVLLLTWIVDRIALARWASGWVTTSHKSYRFAALGARRSIRTVINIILFVAIYAGLSIFAIPPLAAQQGRVPLPCSATKDRPVQPANPAYCALNRNYVDARMVPLLVTLARAMDRRFTGTVTVYLDAGFPLLDGFPLLPHLSHNGGRKLDLAYYYLDAAEKYQPGLLRSPIGYWAFEQPAANDKPSCEPQSWITLRWDMAALQRLFPERALDRERTREALRWIVTQGQPFGVERVFIEPYLAARLGVASPLLGFQGCRAARHDDHIHVQIK